MELRSHQTNNPTKCVQPKSRGPRCHWDERPKCGQHSCSYQLRCCCYRPPRFFRRVRRQRRSDLETVRCRLRTTQRRKRTCRWGGRPGCGTVYCHRPARFGHAHHFRHLLPQCARRGRRQRQQGLGTGHHLRRTTQKRRRMCHWDGTPGCGRCRGLPPQCARRGRLRHRMGCLAAHHQRYPDQYMWHTHHPP